MRLAMFMKTKRSLLRRYFFEKWAKINRKMALSKELNEQGPVRVDILEAKKLMRNLIEFMSKEGYTSEEIVDINKMCQERNRFLMTRFWQIL